MQANRNRLWDISVTWRDDASADLGTIKNGLTARQHPAQLAIPLKMPFSAHRLPECAEPFDINQFPLAPTGGLGPLAAIMRGKTGLDIGGPANIGPGQSGLTLPRPEITFAQHINKGE